MDTDARSMPPKVAEAVNAVMAKVKRLEKDTENSHGKYKFAGIDAFLEECRPLCAEAGLIIVQDEEHFDVIDSKWLLIRYAFTLAHTSGETWAQTPRRSIMVQAAMGAQAFGAAQSYVEKQFMRSLFQIATGEGEDVDNHAAATLPATKKDYGPAPLGPDFQGASGRGKSAHAAKKDGTGVRFQELRNEIWGLESIAAATTWANARADEIKTMPEGWRKQLREDLDEQRRLIAADQETTMEAAE